MSQKVRIGLVEDQLLFRQGIKAILETWPDIEVIFESRDGFSVVEKLGKSEILPDVMLVDLSLPADGNREFSGMDLTLALQESFPSIQVLILSVHDDEYFIAQLIEKGAKGYLVKDSDPQEVYEAIISLHTRGSYINARTLKALQGKLSDKVRPKPKTELLSKREEEVLKLICQQLTAEEIGEKLFISTKTVNGHRSSLLLKTDSKNVTGLVIYAVKHGIVEVI
ncbi:MAG: response regulator transcription factor [Bacteroidia bacterium]|nr:response regulator transcription factor [Bacteroidia bacterium]